MWTRGLGWFRGAGALGSAACGCGGPAACAGYGEWARWTLPGITAGRKRALQERARELREELSDIEEVLKEEG